MSELTPEDWYAAPLWLPLRLAVHEAAHAVILLALTRQSGYDPAKAFDHVEARPVSDDDIDVFYEENDKPSRYYSGVAPVGTKENPRFKLPPHEEAIVALAGWVAQTRISKQRLMTDDFRKTDDYQDAVDEIGEEAIPTALRDTAAMVSAWWPAIFAVASRLRRTGWLSVAEVDEMMCAITSHI